MKLVDKIHRLLKYIVEYLNNDNDNKEEYLVSHREDKKCNINICSAGERGRAKLWSKRFTLIITSSASLLVMGLLFEFIFGFKMPAQLIFLGVVAIAGHRIIMKGILSLIRRRIDINFLMSIAAAGAFSIGHGEEGAAVVFLFFIAETLEDYARERTKESITSLIETTPDKATVKEEGSGEKQVEVEKIELGSTVIVRPGNKVPVDGVVTYGVSSVNQASITGESKPVSRKNGDEVFAGSVNQEGYLEVKVTKPSNETILAKMIKLVEEAEKQKSRTEKFIDRFARFYTPSVIVFALVVGTVPVFIFGLPFSVWIYRALVLLVISCPCALAISTPVSMVSGIASAARNGVLIKGGDYVEEIRNVKAIAFDKTGTLTLGKPVVKEVIGLNGHPREEVLQIAASLESLSEHPVARAIVRKAKEEKINLASVENFKSITGKGIRGKIGNKQFYVGNQNLFQENGIDLSGKIGESNSKGTVILIGNNQGILGNIVLVDEIKANADKLMKELKGKGIRTIMLTGDTEEVASYVARETEVDEYYAQLLPEEKVRMIDELLERFEHVVMVGDGVNDAPALARAHVGIAMGAAGSDVAIETADVALMQDDLSKVSYLIELSRRTMHVVQQNVFASILIKGSFAALTFPGIITLWLAVAIGDMGLSLAVILNALRIGKINPEKK